MLVAAAAAAALLLLLHCCADEDVTGTGLLLKTRAADISL